MVQALPSSLLAVDVAGSAWLAGSVGAQAHTAVAITHMTSTLLFIGILLYSLLPICDMRIHEHNQLALSASRECVPRRHRRGAPGVAPGRGPKLPARLRGYPG